MSIRNLDRLFSPASIAVIGASSRPGSVGATVLRNVLGAGFKGPVYPVNPKYDQLQGLKTWPSVALLPEPPGLAVICTPPTTVPGLIAALGEKGTRAAVVISAGLSSVRDEHGHSMRELMLAAAKPHLLRILGPNCVGLLAPGSGLNASFAQADAPKGKIAFASQSGAMVTGVLDWARERGIGFSKFISMGDCADVDFGDVIDYLARDPETEAILLYIESVTHARKFMSAARVAARSKPTIVVKAGRMPEGAQAAASHTGALAGADDVYDAAFRRAGMLRVRSTEELFNAAETLARMRPLHGERLAILTNGGGPGVMATDLLIEEGGSLASLSADTMKELDIALPSNWSRGNPVDIIGDAPAQRYAQALQILLRDPGVDAVMLLHAPTAIVSSTDIARAVLTARQPSHNLLCCWLGGASVREGRELLAAAGIPCFDTPEDAVNGFLHMARFRRNQAMLLKAPSSASSAPAGAREEALRTLQAAAQSGRDMLTEAEAKAVLSAYGIPVPQTRIAGGVDEAVAAAREIGFPAAIKILSEDISHKSDVGGVVLNLENEAALRLAAEQMLARVKQKRPEARIAGFTVQPMVRRPEGRELIIGAATDPVFGPVILFGHGGITVEVVADRALALPPLDMELARELISRTRIAKLLPAYRDRKAADVDAVCQVLVRVSDLLAELPQIAELDINPLIADADGVIALDARIRVRTGSEAAVPFAIRPYPAMLEETLQLAGKAIFLRPARPDDVPEHSAILSALAGDSFQAAARLCQIDYEREMVFLALARDKDGKETAVGAARASFDPDNLRVGIALAVQGITSDEALGTALLGKLTRYCAARGTLKLTAPAAHHENILRAAGFINAEGSDGMALMLQPGKEKT